VASIAIKHGANEDEVIGAFLHDTLEEGEDPVAIGRKTQRRFGVRVLMAIGR